MMVGEDSKLSSLTQSKFTLMSGMSDKIHKRKKCSYNLAKSNCFTPSEKKINLIVILNK